MRFDKRSRKIRLSFFFYLFIGLGLLGIFIFMVYSGHERELRRLRQEKIKDDMYTMSAALQSYYQTHGCYPTNEQGLRVLLDRSTSRDAPETPPPAGYLAFIPLDPWGNQYEYNVLTSGTTFDLICLGSDGRPGGTGDAADIHWRK